MLDTIEGTQSSLCGDPVLDEQIAQVQVSLKQFLWHPLRPVLQKQLLAFDEFITIMYETQRVKEDEHYYASM